MNIEAGLIEIAERVWQEQKLFLGRNPDPRTYREAIFAFDGMVPFWGLLIDKKSMAGLIFDKHTSGDRANSAKLIVEHYYDYDDRPPVKQLLLLAAHAVLTAHARNPTGVDGLEIVYRDRDKIVEWMPDAPEIAHIKDLSTELDKDIRQRLFA